MQKSDELISALSQHALYVVMLGNGTAKKIDEPLDELMKRIFAVLAGYGDIIASKKDYNKIRRIVVGDYVELATNYVGAVTADIEAFLPSETAFVSDALEAVVEDYTATVPAIPSIISAMLNVPMVLSGKAQTYDQMMRRFTRAQQEAVEGILLAGYANGTGTAAIAKQIKDNAITKTTLDARYVAHTGYTHAAQQVKEKVYKANDDLVVGYEIVATLDIRTSKQCRFFDGMIVRNTDDYRPAPPFHGRCRTTTAPVLDDKYRIIDKNAKRASSGASGGKQVSADLSYYEWLKTQPAWFQDDALGKTRGLLFRNAGLTPDEFRAAASNALGQPLTLLEMQEKNAKIAEYLKRL